MQFHDVYARQLLVTQLGHWVSKQDTAFTYTFENFFHPFVGDLIERLNRKSLTGLLDPAFQAGLATEFFDAFYTAVPGTLAGVEHRPKEIDLSVTGPYSCYNWELLFHVPLAIAVNLSKNQRFAEARRWFHHIFDPTSNDTSVPAPQRFWRFLAFREAGPVPQIDEQLAVLSKPTDECTPAELELKRSLLLGYEEIKKRPFEPHAVARTRHLAYQYCVVMKYLDNLIAWGDSLFRQDTIESVNEATQLYVLAANLLGRRPQRLPATGDTRPRTYAELKARGLDATGNTMVTLEGKFPLDLGAPTVKDDADAPPFGIGRTLYFCVPRNEKMLGYWDIVADRLFKIRNGMNLDGVVRQLALFDPPLDPGMLVKAAAAGIDIGSIVAGLNQPVSPVRALLLIEQARDLCFEVRGLGAALLAAIEKGDGERLAALRQEHEVQIQQRQQEIRFLQWAGAQEATRSLLTTRRAALERLKHHKELLGLPADPNAPDDLGLTFDGVELNEENFAAAYAELVGKYEKPLTLHELTTVSRAAADAPTVISGFSGDGAVFLSRNEDTELNVHMPVARDATLLSSVAHSIAATLTPIPDPKLNLHFWGLGGTIDLKVGTVLSTVARLAGDVSGITASWEQSQAAMTGRYASYERRAAGWVVDHNQAAHDVMAIGRQILTALIAEQVAHHDYLATKKQITEAQELGGLLRDKFSNAELYAWMQGETSRLYYEYYRFAFDTARRAEQAMKRQLMRPELDSQDFVKFNYWDGGRKGLLSGEALHLDVKRMEVAYHEHDKREYELTKHVSLRRLAPESLLAFKATGRCEVAVPEWMFDLDTPGHYLRRIRRVGLTIPCVAGPYTALHCTLTLTRSSLRVSPLVAEGYARRAGTDARFTDYVGSAQSIVTSGTPDDSGMFDTGGNDARVLPFEGSGVASVWTLELPDEFRQVDYGTITDAILTFAYTAREGGAPLRAAATGALRDMFADAAVTELSLPVDLRHDSPGDWASFTGGTGDFRTVVRKEHFPYLVQRKTLEITGLDLYGIVDGRVRHHTVGDRAAYEAAGTALNGEGSWTFQAPADPAGPLAVLTRTAAADTWLIVRYALT